MGPQYDVRAEASHIRDWPRDLGPAVDEELKSLWQRLVISFEERTEGWFCDNWRMLEGHGVYRRSVFTEFEGQIVSMAFVWAGKIVQLQLDKATRQLRWKGGKQVQMSASDLPDDLLEMAMLRAWVTRLL